MKWKSDLDLVKQATGVIERAGSSLDRNVERVSGIGGSRGIDSRCSL
jgi:hypothetical protein